jgi:hypothetical protein
MAANLDSATILDRILNSLRIPTTDTTRSERVADLMNDVYRDIGVRFNWMWLDLRTVVNTTAKYDTGTLAVTKGSTAITFSSAPTGLGSFAGRTLLVPGANDDWNATYRLETHVANAAGAVLDAAYTGETDAAATFRIYADRIALPADVGHIKHLQRYGFSEPMRRLGPEDMSRIKAFDQREGKPDVFATYQWANNGTPVDGLELVIHPYPDLAYRLELLYRQTLNTEVGGTEHFLIPDDYSQLLRYGTLARAYPIVMNDIERGGYYQTLFNDLLNVNVAEDRAKQDPPRLEVVDQYRQFYRGRRRLRRGGIDWGAAFDRLPYVD